MLVVLLGGLLVRSGQKGKKKRREQERFGSGSARRKLSVDIYEERQAARRGSTQPVPGLRLNLADVSKPAVPALERGTSSSSDEGSAPMASPRNIIEASESILKNSTNLSDDALYNLIQQCGEMKRSMSLAPGQTGYLAVP